MFELTILNKNHKGDVIGRTTKSFNTGAEMEMWYNKSRGRSTDREVEELINRPVINLGKPIKNKKEI